MPPKRKNVEQSSDVAAGIPTKADPPLDVKAEEPKDTKKGKKKAEPDVKAEEPKNADVPTNGHAEEPQKEAKKGRKKAEPPVEAKAEEPPKSEAPSEATEPPKEVKKGRKKAEPASETKTEEPKKADPPSEAKPEEPKEVKKGRNKAEPTKTAEEPKKVEPVVTSEEPKEAKKGRKKADPPSEAKTEQPKKADPPSDAKTEEPKKSDVPPEAKIEEPKEAKKGRKKAEAKNEEPMLVDQSANAKTEQSKEANKGKKKGAKKADDDEPVTKRSKQEKKDVADDVDTSFPTEINPNAKTKDGRKFNKTIVSWNVNGVRAWLEKDGISYLDKYSPDILVIQETKCSESKLPEKLKVAGYHSFFSSGDTEGYAGTALYSKEKPKEVKFGIGIEKHDQEGRVITAEYDKFYLVGAYVPNSGKGLVRLKYRTKEWDVDFRKYLKGLDAKKPVIYCGDLNVAHQEADLKNPKANKNKTAGFHDDERQGFTDLLAEGFFDSFRELYPNAVDCYSFWTYMMNSRAKNVGWRLDYFVLSNRLKKDLCDQVIQQKIMGSDHCPLVLQMHL